MTNLKTIILSTIAIAMFTGCGPSDRAYDERKLALYLEHKPAQDARTQDVSDLIDSKIEDALLISTLVNSNLSNVETIALVVFDNFVYLPDDLNEQALYLDEFDDDWTSLTTQGNKYAGDCEDFHLLLRDKLIKHTDINPNDIKLAIGEQYTKELEFVGLHAWLLVQGKFVNYWRVYDTTDLNSTKLVLKYAMTITNN